MLNILIIEDNASDYKVMASLIERKNYNVFHAIGMKETDLQKIRLYLRSLHLEPVA
jgi:hypothetical protein